MNAPLIWIGLPLIMAVISWFIPIYKRQVIFLAAGGCLGLALLTWLIPLGKPFYFGPWQVEVSPVFIFLGRRFIIENQDLSIISLIYTIGAVWFFSAGILYIYRNFVTIGSGILSLMVAALSVEPFLYAALLIESAVLISVPMLVPPGKRASQGVLRYVIFQTLALPFMLFAGWFASGVEANPADETLLIQTVVLLGLGFAFWLAIFPFYSWVPLFCSEVHPFVAGFILSLLSTVVLLLLLEFLNTYIWLRHFELLSIVFRWVGTLMVITAGIWSAFQQDLRRLLGYAIVMENGFALLALSLGYLSGMEILLFSFIPRILSIWVWAAALSVLSHEGQPVLLENTSGLIQRYPLVSISLIASYFTLAGLPLLPGFPIRVALLVNLSEQSLMIGLAVLFGILGFLLSGFRMLAVLIRIDNPSWTYKENWQQAFILALGTLFLIITGLFPNILKLSIMNLLQSFEYLL